MATTKTVRSEKLLDQGDCSFSYGTRLRSYIQEERAEERRECVCVYMETDPWTSGVGLWIGRKQLCSGGGLVL